MSSRDRPFIIRGLSFPVVMIFGPKWRGGEARPAYLAFFASLRENGRVAIERLANAGDSVTGEVPDLSLLGKCATEPGSPAVLRPGLDTLAGLREWLQASRHPLRCLLHELGAVVLAGLPVRSPQDFAHVRDALISERAAYKEKATPRSDFGDDVYSSTDFPAAQAIRPHNENSYTLTFPGLLMFCCLTAPDDGGATPVTDVRAVLRALPPSLTQRFRDQGWSLVRNYADYFGLQWTTAFGATDRQDVADYCAANLIAHEWLEDGVLRTAQRRSALITHPVTGDEVWFNHLVFWSEWSLPPAMREVMVAEFGSGGLPFSTAFGDGEPVAQRDIEIIDAAYRDATVRRPWQSGDVMLIDNLLSAHGREPFRGDRQVMVAMGEPVSLADCRPTVTPLPGLASR